MSSLYSKHDYTPHCPPWRRLGVLLMTLCLSMPASAAQWQSLEDIRAAARAHAVEQFGDEGKLEDIEIGKLDQRLRLHACDAPLQTFSPNGQTTRGHLTVGVRCEGERPWTLYVPVKLELSVEVLTAATALPRGTVLKSSDLKPIRKSITALPYGYYRSAEALVGMELRRAVRAGDILSPATVAPASLVERGQELWLVAQSGTVKVSMKGEALENGAAGERIKVRNLSSQRVLEAEIIDRNYARVAF